MRIVLFIFKIYTLFLLCFSLAACGLSQASNQRFLRLTSPDGQYVVELTGNANRPTVGMNVVNIEVLKHGKAYVAPVLFHSSGSMDLSFDLGYSRYEWVENDTLQFYRTPSYENAGQRIAVKATNKSTQNIVFTKIFCSDKLLLLDIPPEGVREVFCSAPLGDHVDLFVEGRFADGKDFKQGISFPASIGQVSYYIEISQDKVAILAKPLK